MADTSIYLLHDGGWGPRIRVRIADTPEADEAAAAFLQRAGERFPFDYDDDFAPGPKVADVLWPTCEHGLSLDLCYGPFHYGP